MASGFIILNDGRCWSERWTAYDYLLEMVIEEIRLTELNTDFSKWLQTRIPEGGDIEMGYGFIKKETGENIIRSLDLRELTPSNRDVFWIALQQAFNKLIYGEPDSLHPYYWSKDIVP